jgi:murein DD-endopeptidase MepM/ murein hydrolase activator NlpD
MSSTLSRFAWAASKSKYLVSVAAAGLLAACSADADRFTGGPSGADPVQTASVPGGMNASNAGLDDKVTSKPLASTSTQPPAYNYAQPYKATAYKQPADAVAPAPESAASGPGSTVTVGPGMTLYSLARANNMSVAELAAANGIKPPYSVHTGQTLRIPAPGSAPAQTASYAEPEKAPVAPPPARPFKEGPSVSADAPSELHTVSAGETLYSLGRTYGVSPFAIADANGLPNNAQLTMGQKVRIPAGGAAATTRTAQAATKTPKSTDAEAPGTEEVADAAPAAAKSAKTPEPLPPPAENAATADQDAGQRVAEGAPIDGAPGMRWPVRGKVISGFGPKPNGLKNEGINIAVPEGTSIRAADSGVVAYAGNELKGYGNLVLIRHDNGYVTAYAHAKELFVKRGDTVKRGDVIAKAGQTGSVSSPQLHFEVRKGAVALDPMKFLSSSTASN